MSRKSDQASLFEGNEDQTEGAGVFAREIALEIVESVLQRKQALDHVLEQSEGLKKLAPRDRAFVRMLVATTIRRLGQINDLIDKALEKEAPKNTKLYNILRLGVAQIAFMDVPDHAAVDTAVQLAENCRLSGQKNFVNGLLRTIARVGREWKERQDEGQLNMPAWLKEQWGQDYGLAVMAEIAKANLSEAPLDITIKDEGERTYWANALKATELPNGSLRRISGGAVHDLSGFTEGQWWVQDASAALPVKLFGDVSGQIVYDLCAAPGGKTMQLAALGAQVVALDRSAQRLKRLEQNLSRMRLAHKVDVQVGDAASWKPSEPAAMILLDAPCSATGTVRRHPDVLHLKTPRDVERLSHIQGEILDNAFANLMVGGVLIYCTCSLQKEEGEGQVEAFLARTPTAERLPILAPEIGDWDEIVTEQGDVRVLPFHQAAKGGMDGFYIARLTKLT
ncbi:MAG: MFS transporter [Micavibrio sp.]|nr:MFS transporter [Micavibrio sp.]